MSPAKRDRLATVYLANGHEAQLEHVDGYHVRGDGLLKLWDRSPEDGPYLVAMFAASAWLGVALQEPAKDVGDIGFRPRAS